MNQAADQAAGLRGTYGSAPAPTLVVGRKLPLVAVASGKGGVGKTFLAVNLAYAFHELGRRPLLLDLDWGLANVDVALGLAPRLHAGHVLARDCELVEALVEHRGVTILANGCGEEGLLRFNSQDRAELLDLALTPTVGWDLVLADTHPGIGSLALEVIQRAAATVVVSSSEPTGITDTYALFKVLRERELAGPIGLVINDAATEEQGWQAAAHVAAVSRRFLGREVEHWGTVLADGAVSRCVQNQEALLGAAPRSPAAAGVRRLAALIRARLAAGERA